MIPYGRQDVTESDISAVVDVLRSSHLTQGPAVNQFEEAVARRVGAKFGVAVNSATSALHIACLALGLGEGDLLWTSPITFVASANCARYCGADVDFVDIDPDTFNLCPQKLAAKLAQAERNGRLPKVVVPVHMCGQSTMSREIADILRSYDVKIIEDASHAIGASYLGRPVGGCQYSDVTVFSFHPVKIITSAEGGMALTNDPSVACKMASLRSHGVTRDPDSMTEESHGPWYYQQLDLGWNYRMTDVQAALGLSQLSRIEAYVDRRNELADRYDELLEPLPVRLPGRTPQARSAFHLYVVRLDDSFAANRRLIFDEMREKGIGVHVHYIPVHLQPYYQRRGFQVSDFPAAVDYYHRALSLPLYPGMSDSDQDAVVSALVGALL